MPAVEILEISRFNEDSEQLWGYSIDEPVSGKLYEGYILPINGWVLGRNVPVVDVELMYEGLLLRRAPVELLRFDVARAYSNVPEAERCGFSTAISVLGIAPEFKLSLEVVFDDGNRLPLGVLQGRRQPFHPPLQPKLQPLMVTSLGRMGTTWLMHLLAQHPRIVVYEPYPHELRAFTTWMQMLDSCLVPTDYLERIPFMSRFNAPQLHFWLNRIYVEQLIFFWQRSVEAFYQQLAKIQGQGEPIYFAEKVTPIHTLNVMWELYTQAREIFLVRDFRDMVCSILAFNAKRGYQDFSRQHAKSDEEYIRRLRSDVTALLQSWKQRADRAILIRYEDLILQPSKTLTAILEYLNLDSSPSTVHGMIQRASEETPELKAHKTSSNPKTSIGRWRHDLNPLLQAVCQESFGDILKEFGYDV